MSDYLVALPVGVYNLEDCFEAFTRTGIDGAEVIDAHFGGDEFVGEMLGGKWQKDNDGVLLAAGNQGFIAKLASGHLEMTGASAVAGDYDRGWIISNSKLFFNKENTIVTIELEAPAAVTGTRAFFIRYLIVATDPAGNPSSEDDWIRIDIRNLNNVLEYALYKSVAGSASAPINYTALANNNVVFKLHFQEEKAGHTHVYLDDGETGAFTEQASSPFKLGLGFTSGYVCYQITTDDAVERTSLSDYSRVSYPRLEPKYDVSDANRPLGRCKVFDTMNSATESDWTEVFDCDHLFIGDCVVQNGLFRVWIDYAVNHGLGFWSYYDAQWNRPWNQWQEMLVGVNKTLNYPFLRAIRFVSSQKIVISVRMQNTGTDDNDYYVDYEITLQRGKHYCMIEVQDIYPASNDLRPRLAAAPVPRFGYAGDSGIGDNDLTLTGINSTMTDNFMVGFDDEGEPCFCVMSCTRKPDAGNARFQTFQGGRPYLSDLDPGTAVGSIYMIGLVPFSRIADLWSQYDELTLVGATTATPGVGEDVGVVVFDAQNEACYKQLTAGTHLPAGRYAFVIRDYGVGGTQSYSVRVLNTTIGAYRNEENDWQAFTAANGAWTYRVVFFDITEQDVSDTDLFTLRAQMAIVPTNDVYIDYILIVPLGNGENWGGDIAHNFLRTVPVAKALFKR